MFKRITVGLLFAGLSVTAYAGQLDNSLVIPAGVDLLAADNPSSWSLGIEALFLQSISTPFQYIQVDDTNASGEQSKNKTVSQNIHAGFAFDATYHFAGSDRDVTLGFTHINMDDDSQASISGTQTFSDTFGLILPPLTPPRNVDVTQVEGETSLQYNAIDLVFGQHFHIGDVVDLRPFGGLRFADIDTRDNVKYYNSPITTPAAFQSLQATAQIQSQYEGLGPRVGMDAMVHIASHFSFVGEVGASLLVGNDNENVTLQQNASEQVVNIFLTREFPTTVTNFKNNNNIYVVSELDARAGLAFDKQLAANTSFNIEAGYMVTEYIDAIQNSFQDMQNVSSQNSRDNFGFMGPYVRLQLNLA